MPAALYLYLRTLWRYTNAVIIIIIIVLSTVQSWINKATSACADSAQPTRQCVLFDSHTTPSAIRVSQQLDHTCETHYLLRYDSLREFKRLLKTHPFEEHGTMRHFSSERYLEIILLTHLFTYLHLELYAASVKSVSSSWICHIRRVQVLTVLRMQLYGCLLAGLSFR